MRNASLNATLNDRNSMPHVVTDKCNACKFTDCVEVCPVACFYELDNQVVIHPEDCIDCMACVDVCPVHAIYAEEDLPPEFAKDVEFNATQAHQLKDSGPSTRRRIFRPNSRRMSSSTRLRRTSSRTRARKQSQFARILCPRPRSGKRPWVIESAVAMQCG